MKELIVNAVMKLRVSVPDDMTKPEQVEEIENLIAQGEYFPWQVIGVEIAVEPRTA